MKNVIVVGPDHQNTLGVIRAVGKEGFLVNLIIYSDGQHECKCRYSRFLSGQYIHCAEIEIEIVSSILQLTVEKEKTPVIPTSDFAAMCIDNNYNILIEKCFLPSINGIGGKIKEYMDKFTQKQLADKFDIKMAKTIKTFLPAPREKMNIDYPCILKPVISAIGLKSDIVLANNEKEFEEHLNYYYKKGYEEVLIQEFIKKDYEVCIFGCLTHGGREIYCGALKKIRYSPTGDGASLSFAQFVPVDEKLKKILNVLQKIKYDGLFDVEVFVVGDELYLNEINFRNSGNTWSVVNRGINTPVIWIMDRLGNNVDESTKHYIDDGSFFMNETADLRNVVKRNINFFQWCSDLLRTKSFNKFWIQDIRGSLVWYRR